MAMIHNSSKVASPTEESIILPMKGLHGDVTISPTPILINQSEESDFIDELLSSTSTSSEPSPNSSISTDSSCLLSSVVNDFVYDLTSQNFLEQTEFLVADLNESLSRNSKITMLPNYNISPTGQESGEFLVIDLGGSTLRIAVIKIDQASDSDDEDRSKRIHILMEKNWTIDNSFKTLDLNFFKFIGSKIHEILCHQDLIDIRNNIKTGITWSFPLKTTSYNNGKIVHVSKGYTIHPEIYNQDLKSILESVLLNEFDLHIDVKSILNDSLAVYSAGAFIDKYTKLALVLGTGFNMCCSLSTSDKMHSDKTLESCDKILFNTELSLFGEHLIKSIATKYDSLIDERFKTFDFHFKPFMSTDPNTHSIFQPNELMTSGRYLPELTRLVLVDLVEAKEIFVNISQKEELLSSAYDGFSGELMCFINESTNVDAITEKLCAQYGWSASEVTIGDVLTLKKIVQSIVERAAFIVSVSIVSFIKLLQQHNDDHFDSSIINIGYVGSVLKHFNVYRDLVKQYVNDNDDIKRLGVQVDFKLIENSSIIGAAIGAAYYS